MRKLLLTMMAAVTLTAAAQSTFSGQTVYGFNYNPYTAMSINGTNVEVGQAMQMRAINIKQFKGRKVVAIAVPNGRRHGTPTTNEITLFVGSGIDSDGKMTYTQQFKGEQDLTKPYEYNFYTLPEPIELTDDTQPFWVGYTCMYDYSVTTPLVVDYMNHTESNQGGYMGFGENGGDVIWGDYRSQCGFGCIRVVIEGEGMSANNVSVYSSSVPGYATPGSKATASLAVFNNAYNTIEDITVTYTVGEGEAQTINLPLSSPCYYNFYSYPVSFELPIPDVEQDGLPVKFEITGINQGNSNNATASKRTDSSSLLVMGAGKGVQKTVVAEEGTGTWCGWCVRGIVGMDKMAAEYPETFIPIAVHNGDNMSTTSYNSLFSSVNGLPGALVNRTVAQFGSVDPSYEGLMEAYAVLSETPSCASVKISAIKYDETAKKVEVTADVNPAIDLNAKYALAYVITEDGVGPYDQANYYSGGASGNMDGWESKESSVSMLYDHVARNITSYQGISGSLPTGMKAGQTYSYTGKPSANTVGDLNNCHIIALLINQDNGTIENAVSMKYAEFSGIEAVEADTAAGPATYYDLQGRKVLTPAPGNIYVRQQGKTTSKIRY